VRTLGTGKQYLKNVIMIVLSCAANGFSDSLVSNEQIFEELVQEKNCSTLKKERFCISTINFKYGSSTSLKEAINAKTNLPRGYPI
jgi:hypothetical protein